MARYELGSPVVGRDGVMRRYIHCADCGKRINYRVHSDDRQSALTGPELIRKWPGSVLVVEAHEAKCRGRPKPSRQVGPKRGELLRSESARV
jgi:hypothetical protein